MALMLPYMDGATGAVVVDYTLVGCPSDGASGRRLLQTGNPGIDAVLVQILQRVLVHVPEGAQRNSVVVDMASINTRYNEFNATFVLHWNAAGGGAMVIIDTVTASGDVGGGGAVVVNGSTVAPGTTRQPYTFIEVTSTGVASNESADLITLNEYMFGRRVTTSGAERVVVLGFNLVVAAGLLLCALIA